MDGQWDSGRASMGECAHDGDSDAGHEDLLLQLHVALGHWRVFQGGERTSCCCIS